MMNDFTNVGQLLNDMEIERDEAIARADALAAEVERLTAELQNTTVDRDMALRYAGVLKNERDALRAQLDAAGQYEIAHKLRTGDFEVVTAPPQD